MGNSQGANDFIFRRHPELGGQSPFDVSGSEIGACQVESILQRVASGSPL
ncbi:antitoxin Xre/MbcA/ParS toxin-binding domain-containing protein [Kordiimonas sp.]